MTPLTVVLQWKYTTLSNSPEPTIEPKKGILFGIALEFVTRTFCVSPITALKGLRQFTIMGLSTHEQLRPHP